jgi:hypothetical protein
MAHRYHDVCDEYGLIMRLYSKLNLPRDRATVLLVFDRIKKSFRDMTSFRRTEDGNCEISGTSDSKSRWACLGKQALRCSSCNFPEDSAAAALPNLILESAPSFLGLNTLEISRLEAEIRFDFDFLGNQDAIVAETLLSGTPLFELSEHVRGPMLDCNPSYTVALNENCSLQARISVGTTTSVAEIRDSNYRDGFISVYLTVRQCWSGRIQDPAEKVFQSLVERAHSLCESHVIPKVVKPLKCAIALRS